MTQIYSPKEDSYLLEKSLKKELPKQVSRKTDLSFLEIGSGSGIILETAFALGIKNENILGTDINKNAVEHCESRGFNCIYSDLFENINEKYDIIVFNPPYLPKDFKEAKDSRISTTGGEKGGETINLFLEKAKNNLRPDGKIFLLTSSLTEGINWEEYERELVDKEELFMETLYVWKLTIKKLSFNK